MRDFKVIWAKRAENQLYDIHQYFSEHEFVPGYANNLLIDIKEAAAALSYSPYWPMINKKRKLRRRIVNKYYLILFTMTERPKVVRIQYVIDARRDWQKLIFT